jgi:hypothetical protein
MLALEFLPVDRRCRGKSHVPGKNIFYRSFPGKTKKVWEGKNAEALENERE